MDYKSSGVDIDAGNETVRRIKGLARATFTPGVLSEIGSFGGLFTLGSAWRDPVLVSSADGVGTKLKIAFMTGRHDTIGVDLVNHCVNDILVQGAVPLFFLDYLATGRLSPDVAEQVVKGLARGCQDSGCALLGLPTSGLHTNGYSLARRIVFERLGLGVDSHVPDLGETVGEALLRPHRSYLPVVKPLLRRGLVKGMAHITGGGITDNLPRILPDGTRARVDRLSWRTPALFRWLGESGSVPEMDLRRSFNMGIGLILVVADADVAATQAALLDAGEANATVIGAIEAGPGGVRYA